MTVVNHVTLMNVNSHAARGVNKPRWTCSSYHQSKHCSLVKLYNKVISDLVLFRV